jgi:hypothetical protein
MRKVGEMQETGGIEAWLRAAATLPDTLAASFDAFELIRRHARGCEEKIPALFAAFMTTADAAVEGREAIAIAPSLPPPGRADGAVSVAAPSPSMQEITRALAALGALLRDRLWRAARIATTAGDRAACTEGALAAGRICELMAGDNDDAGPR